MKIKTGDNVKVLSGKDRGKTGKVLQIIKNSSKNRMFVVVEGINKVKKHLKKQGANAGRIIELDGPVDISNVALIDPKTKKSTRVGYTKDGDKKKRVSKKSKEVLS